MPLSTLVVIGLTILLSSFISGTFGMAGGMVLLHPERALAAWLRSGVPLLRADPKRAVVKAHALPDAALKVPVCVPPARKESVPALTLTVPALLKATPPAL